MSKNWSRKEKTKVAAGYLSGLIVDNLGKYPELFGYESGGELYQDVNQLQGDVLLGHAPFGFSLNKTAVQGAEIVPEVLDKAEEVDNELVSQSASWINEKYFDALADPNMTGKIGLGLIASTGLTGKEFFIDSYADPRDIAGNYFGTAMMAGDEYGDGGILDGWLEAYQTYAAGPPIEEDLLEDTGIQDEYGDEWDDLREDVLDEND